MHVTKIYKAYKQATCIYENQTLTKTHELRIHDIPNLYYVQDKTDTLHPTH